MDAFKTITLPQCVQIVYILISATTLFVNAVPELQTRFVRYGKTRMPVDNNTKDMDEADRAKERTSSTFDRFLDYLASLQVPHSYFGHFYIISIASSLFLGYQILSRGKAITALINCMAPSPSNSSQTLEQILIAWSLVLVQGSRRLHENYFISKKSNSKMWFVNWILGWIFYLALGIAIWAEGSAVILSQTPIRLSEIHPFANPPSLKSLIGIPLFILSSGVQHDCHVYLSTLKKYTLPNDGPFKQIICPHYFAECLIYVSLTIITAPRGCFINRTVATALIFVVTNLGVTASINQKWYEEKFGADSVKGRWKMIPFIY